MSEEFDKQFWGGRYGDHASLWVRQPNPQLVAEASALPPGTALDAGCGEGADAIWLASHGWQVTAVDFAGTALNRARERADSLGTEIPKPIDWVEADLTSWQPPPGRFDLVTSHYVHLTEPRHAYLERLGNAVAPGGLLLVVDHHPAEERPSGFAAAADGAVTAERIADGLDPRVWQVTVADSRTRTVAAGHHRHGGPEADPDGRPAAEADEHGGHEHRQTVISDVVLAARRRL